jgi:hypothetical protein
MKKDLYNVLMFFNTIGFLVNGYLLFVAVFLSGFGSQEFENAYGYLILINILNMVGLGLYVKIKGQINIKKPVSEKLIILDSVLLFITMIAYSMIPGFVV